MVGDISTPDERKDDLDNKAATIKLTESEVEKISKLYQVALDLSSHSLNSKSIVRPAGESKDLVEKKRKAWHDVQDYLDELGRKYNYDPEKYVINKITRKLEVFRPDL